MRARRSRWALSLRRFARAKRGAAAVEFAMLAVPFFLIIAGMAEVTLMGFAQSSLDFAVSEAARNVRTGQAQTANETAADMRSGICNTLNWLISVDCQGTLFLDVRTYNTFGDVQTSTPTLNANGMAFNMGGPSSIVMVRAYFQWPLMTPFFQQFFANMPNGQRLISSSSLFRNEPYPTNTGSAS